MIQEMWCRIFHGRRNWVYSGPGYVGSYVYICRRCAARHIVEW